MNTIIQFLIESSLCSIFFIVAYYALLRYETYFILNRIYLNVSLFLSFIIPLLSIDINNIGVQEKNINYLLSEIAVSSDVIANTAKSLISINISNLENHILLVYSIVAIILALRLVVGAFLLYKKKINGHLVEIYGKKVIIESEDAPAYSFFNWIFLPERKQDDSFDSIYKHELYHSRSLHSIDIMVVEIATAILWFNPAIYFYKKAIKENHEFSADRYSIANSTNNNKYNTLLLNANSTVRTVLANSFNSFIKRRIKMLSKEKSHKAALLKYLTALPIVLILIMAISSSINARPGIGSEWPIQKSPAIGDDYASQDDFVSVEKMPVYKGDLAKFLAKNLKYPDEARKAGFQAKIFVGFKVAKDGTPSEFKINDRTEIVDKELAIDDKTRQGLFAILEAEALRCSALLKAFEPAIQEGKPVEVWMTLPIVFRLK